MAIFLVYTPDMRKTFFFLFLLSSANAFACSEAMKPYTDECKSQDRYLKLNNEFSNLSININELKGYKIPKAVGKANYFSLKNDYLNHSDIALSKNKDWQIWNNGQKFINALSPIFLEIGDVTKLHKTLFSERKLFNNSVELGKLRTNNGETNPKISLTCLDKILDDKIFLTLINYDLKSAEGYPLLTLENFSPCDDKNFSSADLHFYKGASVRVELNRWITDVNDMIARYENQTLVETAPYNYLADMRRWFLAIRPFNSGNEEVVAALLDYIARRLELPPVSLGDITAPIYLSTNENRDGTVKKIKDTLSFFEGCLYETKTNSISSECTPLK